MTETYEILAFKYASHDLRTRLDNFMLPDDHAAAAPIDYFVWVVRNDARVIVVDTGMDRREAEGRGRTFLRRPAELLADAGIDCASVQDVIITHMHFDHLGTLDDFPGARFHLQEAEMAFATGACMCDDVVRRTFNVEHVCGMVRKVYSGRVKFYDGDGEVAPGITVHKAPGHTLGLQCVRVATSSGFVVLASDVSHLYENFEKRRPFSITIDVVQTLRSYTRLDQLATSRAHVVPGHDPLVLQRYPAWKPQTQGRIHRLDLARTK